MFYFHRQTGIQNRDHASNTHRHSESKKLVKTINHNLNLHFKYSSQMFGGYIII